MPELTALLVFLVAEMVFFSVKSEFFLAWDNWLNIMVAIAVIGIMAAPGTLLLTAGQLDLSVGSIAAFTSVVTANLALHHNLTVAVIGGILAGLAVGVVNGALVTVFGVSALITTLGTLATFRGLTEVIADGETIIIEGFGTLGHVAAVPQHPGAGADPRRRLRVRSGRSCATRSFGRSMYAIGANPTAARLVGIRSERYIFLAFMLSAACCALSGLILTSQLNVGSPVFGTGHRALGDHGDRARRRQPQRRARVGHRHGGRPADHRRAQQRADPDGRRSLLAERRARHAADRRRRRSIACGPATESA